MKKPRKKKKIFKKKGNFIVGTLRTHPRGFGFVKPQKGQSLTDSIFIPKRFIHDAIEGDIVEVDVLEKISEKGPEGIISAVLERPKNTFVAIVEEKTTKNYILFSSLLGLTKRLLIPIKENLEVGDRIIVKIKEAISKTEISASFIKKLAHITDASKDVDIAIEEFHLHTDFSHEAIQEAKSFGTAVKLSKEEKREDLTKLQCITIDPTTAKDFDDAVSLTYEKNHFYLGVHIADVAHYIRPDSHLDEEALLRCNSTYFPGRVVPMLPHELSSHLCSLKPNVLRFSVSVIMQFEKTGKLVDYKIKRSLIKSQKRFTYEEVSKILKEEEKSPYSKQLELMKKLALLLKKKRFERGSIDFALPDSSLDIDKDGNPTKISIHEYDISHQMIEEFMLKANEVIASYLNKTGKTLIYRIHEEPTKESFEDFFILARSLGFFLPAKPKHQDIQKLFLKAKETPYVEQLSISFIRNMKLAFYSPENLGHYGLALEHYCHFTSPIRRYSDLIAQRLLFNEEGKNLDIQEIADTCSERERVSFRAEMSVLLLKKLRLLKRYFEEDPYRIYPAKITKNKTFCYLF